MLTRRSRRRWPALLVAVAAAFAFTVAPAAPAAAQPDCEWTYRTVPNGDQRWTWTCADGGGGPGGGGSGEWTCHTNLEGQDVQVPCTHSTFGWFTEMFGGCYITPATPQPAAGDGAWDDNDPDDGVVYTARCFATEGVDGDPFVDQDFPIFLPAVEAPILDRVEEAIGLLELRGPDIHMAPSPEGTGLVGLPVWMWTPETASTWGPEAASLDALGMTIHVEANAERIRWDMGDGTEVTCEAPGTPYEPKFVADSSPDCPHTYEEPSRGQPEGRYTVTATTEWRIDWEVGQTTISGSEFTTRTSSTSVRINELQVVTS